MAVELESVLPCVPYIINDTSRCSELRFLNRMGDFCCSACPRTSRDEFVKWQEEMTVVDDGILLEIKQLYYLRHYVP